MLGLKNKNKKTGPHCFRNFQKTVQKSQGTKLPCQPWLLGTPSALHASQPLCLTCQWQVTVRETKTTTLSKSSPSSKLFQYMKVTMEDKNYTNLETAMWSHPSVLSMEMQRQACQVATAFLVKPCSGQSPPPGWEAQAGLRVLGSKVFKKEKKKKKERKKEEKQREATGIMPEWASLTAFLPGPSPRAATMAKY